MTAREVWEGMLTELSKVNAPSMLLQDFNYFFNKAINQYINKRYNIYDVNQQTTDDLRVLKATAALAPTKAYQNKYSNNTILGTKYPSIANLQGATYEVTLPSDYLHLLNCICVYKVKKTYKCYDKDTYVQFAAKRLTADAWSVIINDYYNRPLPERPYYYLHNVNQSVSEPTNLYNSNIPGSTDQLDSKIYVSTLDEYWDIIKEDNTESILKPVTNSKLWELTILDDAGEETQEYKLSKSESIVTLNTYPLHAPYITVTGFNKQRPEEESLFYLGTKTVNGQKKVCVIVEDCEPDEETFIRTEFSDNRYPRTINLGGNSISLVEKPAGLRHSNATEVRCEIRYGKDDSVFELVEVLVDYIKSPQTIRLTQEQVNLTEDTSQIMEFPDYVCQEIINELTMLVMENTSDPRLQTNPTVTKSIANPAQQQAPQPQAQQA